MEQTSKKINKQEEYTNNKKSIFITENYISMAILIVSGILFTGTFIVFPLITVKGIGILFNGKLLLYLLLNIISFGMYLAVRCNIKDGMDETTNKEINTLISSTLLVSSLIATFTSLTATSMLSTGILKIPQGCTTLLMATDATLLVGYMLMIIISMIALMKSTKGVYNNEE